MFRKIDVKSVISEKKSKSVKLKFDMKTEMPRSFKMKPIYLYISSGAGFCSGKSNGNYEDPDNCYGFISCSNGRTFKMKCPSGLKYNKKIARCDWPQNVQCGQGRVC